MKKFLFALMICLAGSVAAYKFPPSYDAMNDSIGQPFSWRSFGQTAVDSMADKPVMEKQKLKLPVTIVVNKKKRRLYVYNQFGDTIKSFPCCPSANYGQKQAKDDSRTPEGTFGIWGIYNSTNWTYKDTNSKCYGPWFIYLKTGPWTDIGIHGTNSPGSVPGRHSHGCIRLHNEDIRWLKLWVTKETKVIVLPDYPEKSKPIITYTGPY